MGHLAAGELRRVVVGVAGRVEVGARVSQTEALLLRGRGLDFRDRVRVSPDGRVRVRARVEVRIGAGLYG